MAKGPLDKIFIRDLALRCVIGINPEERREKQDVLINIVLHGDLREACRGDRIEDAIDYKAVKKKVVALVEQSACFLVERLAERIAETCLEDPKVRRIEVRVEKPGALRFARSVGVEIVREAPLHA